MKTKKKIVITGGPGSGKTTLINGLKEMDYHCFDEIAREFIQLGKQEGKENYFKEAPKSFSQFLWTGRIAQYNEAIKIHQNENNNSWIFFDRGIPDVVAYLKYSDKTIPAWESEVINYPYDLVFFLTPEVSIYQQDALRMESFQEAMDIHLALKKTYLSIGNCIEVPFLSPKKRLAFILSQCHESET